MRHIKVLEPRSRGHILALDGIKVLPAVAGD